MKKRGGDPKQKLLELIKLSENQLCADCGAKGPRWASSTIGVFMCIRCSGLHRNLGTHISFVRSVNLDEWKPEQVARMAKWGNKHAKEYFEYNIPPDYQKPTEHSSVQHVTRFIRDKYEFCKFVPPGMPERDPRRGGSPLSVGSSTSQQQHNGKQAPPEPVTAPPTRASKTQQPPLNVREATVVPKKKQPPPQPKPVQAAVPDLLDFSTEVAQPSPPPPPQQQQATQQPTAQANTVPNDLMNAFSTPNLVDAGPSQPAASPFESQQQNRITSDAILAMYSTPQFGGTAPVLSPNRGTMPVPGYPGPPRPQQQFFAGVNLHQQPNTFQQPASGGGYYQQQMPTNISSAMARPPMMNPHSTMMPTNPGSMQPQPNSMMMPPQNQQNMMMMNQQQQQFASMSSSMMGSMQNSAAGGNMQSRPPW